MSEYQLLLDLNFPADASSWDADYLTLQLTNRIKLACAELKINYKLTVETKQKPEVTNV